MSNLEAKIKITAENQAASGLNAAAASAEQAAGRISSAGKTANGAFSGAMADLKNQLQQVNATVEAGFARMADNIEQGVSRAESQIDKLGDGLGRLGGMLAGFLTADFIGGMMKTADSMQVMHNQLVQVTGGEREATAVKGQLLEVANRTAASIESTADLYTKTSRAMKDYGVSSDEVLKFTEATANAMTVGGVAAEQQAAAIMQLSQALGSGVLQGDEFKSISEAAPVLLDTIAEYMGKSRAEIKKLGSEGQLTADVIFKAISGSAEKFAEQAAKMPLTMGNALTIFQNNWKMFTSNLMNDTGIMSAVASVIKLVADNLNYAIPIVVGLSVSVAAATASMIGLNLAMLANPVGLVVAAVGLAVAAFQEFKHEIDIFGDGMATLGDTVDAVFSLISDIVGGWADWAKGVFAEFSTFVNDELNNVSGFFSTVFDHIVSFIMAAVNGIVNYFATGFMLIREAASNLPGFFGNLGGMIANVFLAAIEGMVNRAIGMINGLIGMVNSAAATVGMAGIQTLGAVNMGRVNDGGLGARVGESLTKNRVGEVAAAIKGRAIAAGMKRRAAGGGSGGGGGGMPKSAVGSGAGGGRGGSGGGGRKGGGRKSGGSGGGGAGGREKDPMQAWQEEINAQKLAHETMRIETKSHADWNLSAELAYWRQKLAIVDNGSKTGQKVQAKINEIEKQLAKQTTEAKLEQVKAWEKADLHRLEMEAEAADQLLSMGQITKLQRLDAEIEFENRRYQIAYDALQERIALAEQDPTYSQKAIAQLQQQAEELAQKHEKKQAGNTGKREQQRRQDAPSMMEMLQDGGKNVWQSAQNAMGEALTAMLTRQQNFRTAMTNIFKSVGQSFIQEMVQKPLMAMMQRAVQESSIWQMLFTKKQTLEATAAAQTVATKTSETSTVVGQNATQAASGAAAAMAGIPYVGPVLAMAAMGAMMAAVMGLMGGGGDKSTTTVTRIPSAAGGWDIPSGVNPITQLHEDEMVLPAEQAQVIRDMASGGGETVVINTTGGDFVHKRDLAKLLKKMGRDFKMA